jgi:uncharacterized protein
LLTKVFQCRIDGCRTKSVNMDIQYIQNGVPKPIVIFCHGYKGFKDWGAWNLVASKFAQAGFIFIKFNFSHNGGTDDQLIDFPDTEAFAHNNYSIELDDLNRVIDWVEKAEDIHSSEKDLNRISLIGHSRGGGIALLKASQDKRIGSIALWASVSDYDVRFPYGEALANWEREGVYYVANARTGRQLPHNYQFYLDYQDNIDQLDIRKNAKLLDQNTLVIHAADDEAVHFSEAMRLAKWIPNSKLIILPQGGHTFGARHPFPDSELPIYLEEVVDTTIEFLE